MKHFTYEPLINELIYFFDSGKPRVSAEKTLEIFSFMKAADLSKEENGVAIQFKRTGE